VEVTRIPGGGKLKLSGSPDKVMRDSITTAFDYLRARKRDLGIEAEFDSYDFHVQVVDLMGSQEGSAAGMAFFVAVYSLLKAKPVLPGLVVMGQVTIQGNIWAFVRSPRGYRRSWTTARNACSSRRRTSATSSTFRATSSRRSIRSSTPTL